MEQRKRVIFTVINDLSYDQRMQRISETLALNNYEVLLVGRRLPNSKMLPPFPFQTKRLQVFFKKGPLFYLEYNLRLFFFLLFSKVDLLGAIDLDTLLAHALVSKLRGKKLIYDAHEYFTEVPELVGRKKVQAVWEKVARFGIPQASLCYTVSEGLTKLFEEKYHKPFKLIRNLPFKKTETTEDQTDDRFILYQGALNKGRCLEQLIEAIQELPVKLKIAGEGDLSVFLRNQARKQIASGQIEFLGYVNPDELKKLTPQAWLGYNVLENQGLSYYYSLANKFFDYIQNSVPVMCSSFPEYVSIASQHPTIIFAEPTVESVRLEIQKLLNDKNLYQQLKLACIPAAEKLNWENESKVLLELYEQIV